MNFLKKTALFALISGLMIGTARANMEDNIESFLRDHNWHRTTIWDTKMRTQDIFLSGPLNIFCIAFGAGCLQLPFTRNYSIVTNVGKSLNHPFEDVIIGGIALTMGIVGLGLIYQKTKAIQAENK